MYIFVYNMQLDTFQSLKTQINIVKVELQIVTHFTEDMFLKLQKLLD